MSDADFSGTRAPKHAVDAERLGAWLAGHVEGYPRGAPLEVRQFKGGQSNPTYLLAAGGQRWVLRRKPPGNLLPSAHAVDREHRVISALAGSDVPVPRALALCTDDAVIGSWFYVMEHVEGRIFWDPVLPGLEPAERGAIYEETNRVIAALHAVPYRARGLADYGKEGAYFQRQIERWTKQYQASPADRIEAMEQLIRWLPEHVPPGEETSLVHGDFRLDNLIFHPTEPRVLAVLDWELSTLGHPLSDFAYHCMTWRVPAGLFRGLAGADLAALGVPTEAAYVARYCERLGRGPIEAAHWDFYLAFNLFRLAAILHGVLGRALQGNAASEKAMMMGQAAWPLADLGWQQAQRVGHSSTDS